ncbi:MAG: hypothetical protein Q7R72_00710 [bacterium]|nr:hypothetical protein [bacterium]
MKTLAPSTVTTRDPKGLKFVSIIEAAYNKAGLSEEEAQCVNDTPGLSERVTGFIADNRASNKFKNEEVASNYGYLSDYKAPKPIHEQVKIIHQLFRNVSWGLFRNVSWGYFRPDERTVAVPSGAEGLFAIPKWQTIAPTYSEAIQKVLDAIKKVRYGKFVNYRDGQINEQRLRQTAKTKTAFDMLGDEQKDHDILVVSAQFGIRHRGRSVRRAREVFSQNEFGLGAFAVGIMILTHAKRFQHYDDLWIDCAGDEFDDPYAGVRFAQAPYFGWHGGAAMFNADGFSYAYESCGSASAFVPQN